MSVVVPASLVCVAELLRCPACLGQLAAVQGSLICARRHTYDVARPGYVTLLRPEHRCPSGDDASMIRARAAIQEAGHFEPLTAALVRACSLAVPDASVILDAGAGTGHHLAGVLAALNGAFGVALDVSRAASRRGARAQQRMAWVRCNIWREIPLCDASVDLAMSVFAPRNPDELARVLRPGGAVIVATPAPDHLRELAPLHAVNVHRSKAMRLEEVFAAWPSASPVQCVRWTVQLTRGDAERILMMGPAAHHLRSDFLVRLSELGEPVTVTAAVELRTFRNPGGPCRPRPDASAWPR
jgi:23S rRNA (guanine745-N1)-methyltransferase